MTITDNSLASTTFTAVRSKVVTAMSGTGVSVNGSYNDKDKSKHQIVISPAIISENSFPFNGQQGTKNITMVVEVYSEKSAKMDEYSDLIRTELKKNDIAGISLESIEEDYDFTTSQEDKLHLKTLSCSYIRE